MVASSPAVWVSVLENWAACCWAVDSWLLNTRLTCRVSLRFTLAVDHLVGELDDRVGVGGVLVFRLFFDRHKRDAQADTGGHENDEANF